jgi:uncharacterized protein (UPF0333 family)
MNTKAQGALEYLLLIGGAVVVAAIAVIILLNISETSSKSTEITQKASICTRFSALDGLNNCQVKNQAGLNTNYIWEVQTKKCWKCVGTYPNCTVDSITATEFPDCGAGNAKKI